MGTAFAVIMFAIDRPISLVVYLPISLLAVMFMVMTVLKDPGVIPQNLKKIKRLEYIPQDEYIQN